MATDSITEREARDQRVRKQAAEGATTKALAEAEGVTERTIRRIVTATTRRSTGRGTAAVVVKRIDELDSFAEVERALAVQEHVADRLLALTDASRSDAITIGALKGAAAIAAGRLQLMGLLGMVRPAMVAEARTRREWELLTGALMTAVRRCGVDPYRLAEAYQEAAEVAFSDPAQIAELTTA